MKEAKLMPLCMPSAHHSLYFRSPETGTDDQGMHSFATYQAKQLLVCFFHTNFSRAYLSRSSRRWLERKKLRTDGINFLYALST